VWNAADLARAGAHPDAAFGIDTQDACSSGNGHDVLVKPSTSTGAHGFAPDRQALHDAGRADAGGDPRGGARPRSRLADSAGSLIDAGGRLSAPRIRVAAGGRSP
jgi:hypothetical protein